MKWLVSHFGGIYHTKKEATDKHATAYEWRPKGEGNTKRTLLAVLPYLVIKREQAILALKYIDLPQQAPREREAIYQRMRELNQKGPKTVETNTLSEIASEYEGVLMIESGLTSDCESGPVVTQVMCEKDLAISV